MRRVFIIQILAATHREHFEALLKYIDTVTSQIDPRTFLPSRRPWSNNKFLRCARLFCSQVGPKLQVTIRPCSNPLPVHCKLTGAPV